MVCSGAIVEGGVGGTCAEGAYEYDKEARWWD